MLRLHTLDRFLLDVLCSAHTLGELCSQGPVHEQDGLAKALLDVRGLHLCMESRNLLLRQPSCSMATNATSRSDDKFNLIV